MKLSSYRVDGRPSYGIIQDSGVIDVPRHLPTAPAHLAEALAPAGLQAMRALASRPADFALSELVLLPPVASDKIFGVLLNYESARIAQGRPKLQYPHLTTRFADAHVGSGSALVSPAATREFDFEGEIAVVIGKGGRHIAAADAWDCVAGLSAYNDATPRDWMRHSRHFTAAKNFPRTAGFGPWIVTLDEFEDLSRVGLSTRLNGEPMQQGTLGDLTFGVPELVAYISTFTALRPGDVIATGTPAGSGYKRMPPRFLQPGDVVEVEVGGVGTLVNTVASEAASSGRDQLHGAHGGAIALS